MTNFEPWFALLGGVLIGASASLLWVANGRVAGVSGMVGGLFSSDRRAASSRAVFLLGLLAGGVVLRLAHPSALGAPVVSVPQVALAGLLVGFGTRLGGGCTSGHGVCGVSRLSRRSLVATATFMVAGMISAVATRYLLRGGHP